VQPSPARADSPDGSWLPVPSPDSLPSLEELLTAQSRAEPERPEAPIAADGPGRAEPHDATAWLPLPEVADLPPIQNLIDPTPVVAPVAPREITAEPSPARAEPADATAWLPLPSIDELPDVTELVDPERGAGMSPPPARPRRRLRERLPRPTTVARFFVFLLVIVTLGGAYYGVSNVLDQGADVVVRVDGRRVKAETGVSTVAGVLDEQRVQLGEYDRVEPAPSAPIHDGMTVQVVRAFTVNADVDGNPRTLYSTYRTPTGFLDDAAEQLDIPRAQIALRDPVAVVLPESSVAVRTKKVGTLLVDGSAVNYNSPAHNVAELLALYQIVLGPADFMQVGGSREAVALDTELPDNASIEVVRVAAETTRVLERYDVADERRPDPHLNVGETRVSERVTGVRWVTYALELHDGREISRRPISAVPSKGARPFIEWYGTKYNPLWDKMAQCETGGNWKASGQQYQGGLGIYFQNWNHYGGLGFAPTAGLATKYEQIIVAERIREEHGWHAWGCADRIGL